MLNALIILGIVSIILLFLLLLQIHQIRGISGQLKEIKTKDTNTLLYSYGSGKASAELIGEINSLISEMQRIRMRYRQKHHALDQMMINISHDLRTPLTSAMGYIHIIRNSDLAEEEKNRELAIIEKRLLRLEELINSFFEFSQIISSEKQPEREVINIVAVLEESIVHYYDDYCDKGRKIIFMCRERKLPVNSNKNMLLRIFDNLIGNSLKHGIGDLTVSIDAAAGIRICFKNELCSTDIDISHIFDEFYTTDISRTKGNTGLGLAIVKQFTEMLGGTVSAQYADRCFELTVSFPVK
ncbi:MAG: HAMP domain-containing histidine kinase [Lachnospiraceae bacterium]|nr:HAMP domain-containing histidine kinase [Lachnospiraceae bacterium]